MNKFTYLAKEKRSMYSQPLLTHWHATAATAATAGAGGGWFVLFTAAWAARDIASGRRSLIDFCTAFLAVPST